MGKSKKITAILLCCVLVFASMLCGCEQKKHVQKVQPVLRLDLVKVIPPDLTDLSNVVYSWELTGEEKNWAPIIYRVPNADYTFTGSVYYYETDESGEKVAVNTGNGAEIQIDRQESDGNYKHFSSSGGNRSHGSGVFRFTFLVSDSENYDGFTVTIYLIVKGKIQ